MFLRLFTILTLFWCSIFCSSNAAAQVAEIRVGISEFDERTLSPPYSRKRANENSVALTGEILFEEPEFLKWALSPRPYIGGSLNLDGKTSYGGGGLLWRQTFGDKFYGDFAVGVVVHNGTTEIQSPGITSADLMTPEGQQAARNHFARFDNEIQFGTRLLLREQLALGYNFNKDWAGEIYIEHLSNGKLQSGQINDGANSLGIRAIKKF